MAEDSTLTHPQRVDLIKSMPQESDSEKMSKHLAAQDLQIETYASYATLMLQTKQLLINNPNTGLTELKELFSKRQDELSHPESGQVFTLKCAEVSIITEHALSAIARKFQFNDSDPLNWTDEDKGKTGRYMFEQITGKEPSGNVNIVGNIFGIVVTVDTDSDLKALRKEDRNIGGFYRERESLDVDGHTVIFPLIVASAGDQSGGIISHEVGHAVTKAAIRTLSSVREVEVKQKDKPIEVKKDTSQKSETLKRIRGVGKHRVIELSPDSEWLWYVEIPQGEKDTAQLKGWVRRSEVDVFDREADTRWGKKIDIESIKTEGVSITTEQELLEHMQSELKPFMMSLAKEELLADYQRTRNFSYLETVLVRDGNYDRTDKYLKRLRKAGCLKLPDEGVQQAVEAFWKDYPDEVRECVKAAAELNDIYKKEQLHTRSERLPYVLSMIPFQKWKDSNGRSFLGAFLKEARLYTEVKELLASGGHFSNSNRYNEVAGRFGLIQQRFITNPTESMLSQLSECHQIIQSTLKTNPS